MVFFVLIYSSLSRILHRFLFKSNEEVTNSTSRFRTKFRLSVFSVASSMSLILGRSLILQRSQIQWTIVANLIPDFHFHKYQIKTRLMPIERSLVNFAIQFFLRGCKISAQQHGTLAIVFQNVHNHFSDPVNFGWVNLIHLHEVIVINQSVVLIGKMR